MTKAGPLREEDEGDNEALTLCVASQQSSTHDRAHAHACVSVATFVPRLFPPNQHHVFPPGSFLSFLCPLWSAFSQSRCFIRASAVWHLCLSRCFPPRCACLFPSDVSVSAHDCNQVRAALPWMSLSAGLQNGDEHLERKNIYIMLCYLFYKGKIWNIQISYPDPVTETVMGRTSGDQKTVMSYSSLCVFSSTFSLSLSHLLPLTISLKTLDRQFPRSWVVWG